MKTKKKNTPPDWRDSAESIMAKWLSACESQSRHSDIFLPLALPDRLQRLLAAAYCRDIWPFLKDERSRNAVDVAERFADGLASSGELKSAAYDAATASNAADAASYVAHATAADHAADAAHAAYAADVAATKARKAKWMYHGLLLVSVISPGWKFDPKWRTDTAVILARQMYESRDFITMPILADAIQDAECNEEVLLESMRSPDSKWCRGCRIVDEILGKRDP